MAHLRLSWINTLIMVELLEILVEDIAPKDALIFINDLFREGEVDHSEGNIPDVKNSIEEGRAYSLFFSNLKLGFDVEKCCVIFMFYKDLCDVSFSFDAKLLDSGEVVKKIAMLYNYFNDVFVKFRPGRIICGFDPAIEFDRNIFVIK